MLINGKISASQLAIFIYMFALGSAVLILPSTIVSIAKQDAWITLIMTLIVQLGFAWLYLKLADRFPDETITEYGTRLLGAVLGKCLCIVYLVYFLILSALVLRNVGDFIYTNLLIQTPTLATQIFIMVAVAYGTFLGIEVLGRAGEVLFVIVVFTVLLACLFLLPHVKMSNILPILPEGLLQPLKGVYPVLGFPISELSVVLFLFPYVRNREKLKRYFYFSMALAPLSGLVVAFFTITVMGVEDTIRSPYAVYEMAKKIQVGEFFERIEALVGILWISTIFIKLSLCFYAVVKITSQLFNLSSHRTLILPYVFVVVPFSTIIYDHLSQSREIIFQWPLISLFQGLFLPLLLLLIAMIIRKSNKQEPDC
ncbi:MAG: spore gernimation protein [Paenibacillus sp.]|jgi:spore germination protein KB|nr:spore gernimation protein [Paenibacillus sp.]